MHGNLAAETCAATGWLEDVLSTTAVLFNLHPMLVETLVRLLRLPRPREVVFLLCADARNLQRITPLPIEVCAGAQIGHQLRVRVVLVLADPRWGLLNRQRGWWTGDT